MSHLHERKEKVCLNCGAALIGRYCQECGQENVEPKESFGHLLKHFFEDLTHFDGKFFTTLKPLLFRPGFLTRQYISGRRASYINPIRMYLFISAMFFLLTATFFLTSKHDEEKEKKVKKVSAIRKSFTGLADALNEIDSTTSDDTISYITLNNGVKLDDTSRPKTVRAYDSLQALMPKEKRDGFIERYFVRKTLKTMQYSNEHPDDVQHIIKEKFWHSLPYMLFLTLPLIALLLKLLYVRRKEFYYVSHVIFTIHFYCFVFLLLLVSFTVSEFGYWGSVLGSLLTLSLFIYLFLAMYNFYKQGFGKTLLKYLLLLVFGLGSISILTIALAVNAFLTVGG